MTTANELIAYVAVEYVPICNECGAMDSEFTEDAAKNALGKHMAIEHGIDWTD